MNIKKLLLKLTAVLLIISLSPFNFFCNAASGNDRNFTNLIVFIRFNGEDEFVNDIYGNTTVRQITENSYTKADYSVMDYYEKASNGNIKMQSLYLFDTNGGSLELKNSRGYYCTKSDNNPNGYESYEYGTRLYELKCDWAEAINTALENGAVISNVDRTQSYSFSELDKNGDGYLDSLTVVYKYSDKYSVSWSDCLWNYQTYYDGAVFNDGNVSITSGAYLQFTANYNYLYSDKNGLKFPSLNTAIHETGHIFGLKDLYRSDYTSRVYYMSAMATAIGPIPQYISSKEREALGWLKAENISDITASGDYTVYAASDTATENIICFKLSLAAINKTVYFEYRCFDGDTNKYDTQSKEVFNANGDRINGISLKSGLLCLLADSDTKFPNNLNTAGTHWNYEVLGGIYPTKSDSALKVGESLYITANISVAVTAVAEDKLTFHISGIPCTEHSYSSGTDTECDRCGHKRTLTGIRIATLPDKIYYLLNEEQLNLSGGSILLSYNDGSSGLAEMTADKAFGFNNAEAGLQELSVKHGSFSTGFAVEIYKQGDIDGNLQINATDITLLKKCLINFFIPNEKYDINRDGNVDILDIVRIKKLVSQ